MKGVGRWAVIGEIFLAAVLAFLVAPSLGSLLFSALARVWSGAVVSAPLWDGLVVPLAAQQAALAALGWIGWRRIRRGRRELAPLAVRGVGWGFLLFAVNGVVASLSITVASALLGRGRAMELLELEANPLERLFAPESPLFLVAVGFLLVSVTAPFAEELFFRGYVYGSLQESFGGRIAVWGSALLFAAPHLYVVQFASIFFIGLLLSLAYRRSGHLAVPLVAHGVMNGLVALTALLA